MSKNDMIIVPREPTREMLVAAQNVSGILPIWRAMVAAAPAEQPQGEPVSLPERKITNVLNYAAALSAEGWNACLDEITKLGPLYTRPVQAEPVAPYGWHVEWADSGDHYLFTKVEKRIEALRLDSDVKVVQLYTHQAPAAPGEVERLREGITKHWKVVCDQRATIEGLRAQLAELKEAFNESQEEVVKRGKMLAERDALLERAYRVAPPDLGRDIRAALSASAEPSGSQHKLAMDAACGEIEILRAQLAALRELKLPEFLKLSDEMRAAGDHAEQRAREDQCYSVPVLKAVFFEAAIQRWLDDQEEALSVSAEPSAPKFKACQRCLDQYSCGLDGCQFSGKPSAPVERDELRLHLERIIGQAEYMLEIAENSSDHDEDNDGSFDECREYIEQARAAMDRKPSVKPGPIDRKIMVAEVRAQMDEQAFDESPTWIERTHGLQMGVRVQYKGIKWYHEILFGGNWITASVEEAEAVLERML